MTLPSSSSGCSFSWKRHVVLAAILLVLSMWPFLDVSCPLIELFPASWQQSLVNHHVQYVPTESKSFGAEVEKLPHVVIMHGVETEESVREAIRTYPYTTVLFKGYLNESLTAHVLKKFQNITAGKNYSLMQGKRTPQQRVGGMFSAPLHTDGNGFEELVRRGHGKLVESTLDGIYDGSMKDTYGLFVPVGEGSMHELINWTANKTVPDTSFFGWFSQRTVTTPLHANWLANTLSLQLAGRKDWIMVDPFDMKASLMEQGAPLYVSGKGGVFYPNLKLDKRLQSKMKVARQELGDMLYFPPYASHTVVSDAGLNVMTALRLLKFSRAFKIHPWKTFQAASTGAIKFSIARIRLWLGLDKFGFHFDVSKYDWMDQGVMTKSWSPFYNDLQLEALLAQ